MDAKQSTRYLEPVFNQSTNTSHISCRKIFLWQLLDVENETFQGKPALDHTAQPHKRPPTPTHCLSWWFPKKTWSLWVGNWAKPCPPPLSQHLYFLFRKSRPQTLPIKDCEMLSTVFKNCFCIFQGENKPFFHQINHVILSYFICKSFFFQYHKGKLSKYC